MSATPHPLAPAPSTPSADPALTVLRDVFGYRRSGPARRGDRGRAAGPRLHCGHAHGRGQVADVPAAGAAAGRHGAGHLAAHLAHEGPGGRAARAGLPCDVDQLHARLRGATRAAGRAFVAANWSWSTWRRRRWTARCASSCAAARWRCWWWTRRTASASGATISGRRTAARGALQELDVPVLALTATATRPVARDILRQLGMVKPAGYKGSFFRRTCGSACARRGRAATRGARCCR
jgi:hypothetical protein